LDPDSPAYNISAALSLTGPLDADAARTALDDVVRRHEMLRTRFADVDGVARQLVRPVTDTTDAWRWECVNALELTTGDFHAQLRRRTR
ncbi:condensation domain-containing protein, partial [Halomonas sp. SIMBA_159]